MNFREMVMALFAIVFFTTISLVYNRSMWSQTEVLDNGAKVIQAAQLVHSKLDEIDAKLMSHKVAFNAVGTTFTGTQAVSLAYTGYNFSITYKFLYCDSMGVSLSNQTYNANPTFYSMTVTATSDKGLKHAVSETRIFAHTGLYQ